MASESSAFDDRKKLENVAGIYLISHPATRARYVGCSINIGVRWYNHSANIERGTCGRSSMGDYCRRKELQLSDLKFAVLEVVDVKEFQHFVYYSDPKPAFPGSFGAGYWITDWKLFNRYLRVREKYWSQMCNQNVGRTH